ncbi:MAG: sigma-70 family RNA polymerase sigma factor [Clostridiales bacterium]|nr:sigma-70 family RNA polymerase sigma factor [Clostridiales bacterium]
MSPTTEDWVHALYETYAPDLYRAAKYRLQDPELAWDLTQEVFLTLLDKAGQVRAHPNPGGWLWITLRHKLNREFARQAHRARHEAGEVDLSWLAAPEEIRGASLDDLLPRQLSPRDRALLKLAYEDGLSYRELSALLGVPPATCGTWLYRARQRCRHYLTLPEGGFSHEKKT